MINSQENHLDDLGKITDQMTEDQRVIHKELEVQHKLIKELDEKIARSNSMIQKADLKLRRLIQSSSKFWLWVVIIFQVIVLVIQIFVELNNYFIE